MRLAARALLRTPASTALSVLALALGLGGAIAFASAARALWLAPLPFAEPDRLVALAEVSAAGALTPSSMATVDDWRAQASAFRRLGGARSQTFLVASGSESLGIEAVGQVTAGFLEALGTATIAGRIFTTEELRDGARAVVLSGAFAGEAFGTPGHAVGRTLSLNDVEHVVVGVLPAAFELPIGGRVPRLWTPIDPALYGERRSARALTVVGRLRDAVSANEARSQLSTITARLANTDEAMAGRSAAVQTLHEALRGAGAAPLKLLGVAAALFLLTAAINVAGLQLERVLRREREIGVRLALGAGGRDLLRHLGAEAALLCGAGLLSGLVVAAALLAALPVLFELSGGLPPLLRLQAHSLRLESFGVGIAMTVALLLTAGLTAAPVAVLGRRDAAGLLRGDADGSGGAGGRRGRRAIVVAQVALSVVLVMGAGLLLRSFAALAAEDPGFDARNATTFGIGIPEARYPTEPEQIDLHHRLDARLRDLPGVAEVGLVARLPLGGSSAFATGFELVGARPDTGEPALRARINVASAGFFRALGIPLQRGRLVDWDEGPEAPRALVVSSSFASRYLPVEPLGTRLRLGFRSGINPPGTEWRVVGVVGDVRHASLGEEPEPTLYLPASQFPLDGGSYVLAGAPFSERHALGVRDAVWDVDAQLQEVRLGSMQERVGDSLAEPRSALAFGVAFGAMALLLTGLGIYGALAVETVRRRRELAIRQALGATPAATVALVLRAGLSIAALGALLGLPVGWQVTALLASVLHAVRPGDPLTSAAVVLVVAGLAAGAAALPALRAVRVSPIETLRSG